MLGREFDSRHLHQLPQRPLTRGGRFFFAKKALATKTNAIYMP